MPKEIGRIGQRRWGGNIHEEFLPELQGLRGIRTYREMLDNDDMVGAIMFAIKMTVRQATWSIEPGGTSVKDDEAAEFVESCMDDMSTTWNDFISECLSFLGYGWAWHEEVFKRRMGRSGNPTLNSKYSDGLIGWQKLPIRAQDTLYQWEYDDKDNLLGMTQLPPPDYGLITIPMRKSLLFRTESIKDNPEGRSILRNAYRPWYFKRRIQEIEAIGVERDLAGFPVIHTPPGMDIWNRDAKTTAILASLTRMVKGVKRDEMEGIVLPDGYSFELLSSGGQRQFNTNDIIERYDTKIAQTVLADFIMLGHEGVGSFALSTDKTAMFSTAISTYMDIICEEFNRKGIPDLIDINGAHFQGITDYPKMTHGAVEDVDLDKLGAFIKDMTGVGIIVPDDELEDYVRDAAGLPERKSDSHEPESQARTQAKQPKPTDVNPEDNSDETDDDKPTEDEVEEAKRWLGRS